MYRRAQFFNIDYPLTLKSIQEKLKDIKTKPSKVRDKNYPTDKKITLACDFDDKKERDGNYLFGMTIEYQVKVLRENYQKTRDNFTFIFFPKDNVLVVLGRDEAIQCAVNRISSILFPENVEKIRSFTPIIFNTVDLLDIISKLKDDDPKSWCSDYKAKHGKNKYQGKKTKSNFSLCDGQCVLDDKEALGAIKTKGTSINPVYKFFTCPKLNLTDHSKPKRLSFNSDSSAISVSFGINVSDWYRFISSFLLNMLV